MLRALGRISRRRFLQGALALPFATQLNFKFKKNITRIAFGSCADQNIAQPIWPAIAQTEPELFIFGGDNVYADTLEIPVMQKAYDTLASIHEFKEFRKQVPIVATWDDHDFGFNDSGSQYPMKTNSKELFMKFFDEPHDSPRRTREGIYHAYTYGPAHQRTQVILLDLRWFRNKQTLLGEEQWQWLEEQLKQPAHVRLLMSSIQFISDEHEWEKWSNLPLEKERLLNLIDKLSIENLLILSGDMHFGEICRMTTPQGRELYDFTASGLNYIEHYATNNRFRVTLYDETPHFGLVEIDWDSQPLNVRLELRNEQGGVVRTHVIQLRPPTGAGS